MASSNDKVKVIFTWTNPAKTAFVVIKGNQEKKVAMVKSSTYKEFSYGISLSPGKYYYHYIIDSKRMLDPSKPNERINNDIYNVVSVQGMPLITEKKKSIPSKESDDDLIIIDQQNDQSILSLNSMNNSYYSIPSIKIQSNQYQEQKPYQQKVQEMNDSPTMTTVNKKKINERNNNKNQVNVSNTFSIKKENYLNEIEYSFNELSKKNTTPKVIVYNYADSYLIPMEVSQSDPEHNEPNIIKLKQLSNGKEYLMNQEDIFYQPIDIEILVNGAFGNLSQLKEINELSILKNIQLRLRDNKAFCYNDNIFLGFYYGVQQSERNFFLSEFIKNYGRNEALIIKTLCFNQKFNSKEEDERYIIRKYINVNLPYDSWKYYSIIDHFMKVLPIQMKHMLHLSFYAENSIVINFIPLMSSYLSSSELYVSNILFNKANSELPKMIQEDMLIKNTFTNLQYKKSPGSNSNNQAILFLLNYISTYLQESHMSLLISIKNLLISIDHINKYQDIIKLLMIAYFSSNYSKIFQEQLKSLQQFQQKQKLPFNIESINPKNMMFYSNLTILVIIKYLNHLISSQLDPNGLIKGLKNNLLLLFNPTPFDEDDLLLNEVIKKRMTPSDISSPNHSQTQSLSQSQGGQFNKNAISNNFKYYLNENISLFEQNLSSIDLQMINLLENVFELSFLNSLMKKGSENNRKSILIHSFHYSYQISIATFEEVESEFESIKQVWRMDLAESFDKFISDQDQISHFFQITQIIEYTKRNQELNSSTMPFRQYNPKDFFDYYLPILCDIDQQYSKKKDYSKELCDFIKDIQTHQKFKEEYIVTKDRIEIGYQTYEIIMSLLKNVYEEHCLTLQCRIKGKTVKDLMSLVRRKTVMIQKAWKRKLYDKYTTMNHNEFMDLIVSRYKGKDPMLIMFAMKTRKQIAILEKQRKVFDSKDIYSNKQKLDSKFDTIVTKTPLNARKSQELKPQPNNNSLMSKRNSNNNSNSNNNNTSITKNEVNSLKEKLTESREKYKELVNVLVEYEKKLENFIRLINTNQEVKDILNKNGIQIN